MERQKKEKDKKVRSIQPRHRHDDKTEFNFRPKSLLLQVQRKETPNQKGETTKSVRVSQRCWLEFGANSALGADSASVCRGHINCYINYTTRKSIFSTNRQFNINAQGR